jgi:hypothetical protein
VHYADGTLLPRDQQSSDYSVDGSFDVLKTVIRLAEEDDDSVRITYDEKLGYPRSIDVNSHAIDGSWNEQIELLPG